jgi:signal transduction histidine kinase/ActR/RegA family two-component response regulator
MPLNKKKYIFYTSFSLVIAYLVTNFFIIVPSFSRLLIENLEDEARHITALLSPMVVSGKDVLLTPEELGSDERILRISEEFNLEQLKVFSASGKIVFSTAPEEIGRVNTRDYFNKIAASGRSYSKIVRRDAETLEGRKVGVEVLETYVPIIRKGQFIGAFEIYFNIDDKRQRLDNAALNSAGIPLVLMFLFWITVVFLLKTEKTSQEETAVNLAKKYRSPFFFLLVIAVSIFITETAVMWLLSIWKPSSVLLEALFDSSALVIIISPVLYYSLVLPLTSHITQRARVENELQKSRDTLEKTVATRTAELEEKNRHLQEEIAERQTAERALREQVQLLSLGAEVGFALTLGTNLRDMLQQCSESIVANLNATFARIWVMDEEENLLRLHASAGLYTRIDGEHSRKSIDAGNKIGNIALTKKPHLSNSVLGDPQVIDQTWAKSEGIVAFAGHPLLVEGRVVGVMALFSRQTLSEVTIRALASIADQISLGIERKKTEEAYRKVNRALRVLSKCNELLLRARNEREFLKEACRVIVQLGGYHLAWIGFKNEDEGKKVTAVAQSGGPDGFPEALEITWENSERGQGPTGTAIREGKTIVCLDAFADPKYQPWRNAAKQYGYKSSIALPLFLDGEPAGALSIYAAETKAFDLDEIKLLEEMSKDFAYGIAVIRFRASHEKTEKEKSELQKQIRQMQKMQAIGTLAGGIAHDFNNLLTPILGYANLMQYQLPIDNSLLKEPLEQIVKAGNRAKQLVAQILTFSRQTEHQRNPLHIHLIIKEVLKLLRSTIPANIEFKEDIQSECGIVNADATEIHQIIMNLCTNAYHAMRETGGTLEVSLKTRQVDRDLAKNHPQLSEGDYIELTIKDTGYGMDEDAMERIFEPFYTTKSQGEGIGMGLAVVHGIVESLSGAIIVESKKDEGSAFHVFIPRLQENTGSESLKTDLDLPLGDGERILVVDDDETVTQFGQKALQLLGYEVTTRSSSTEAFELIKAKPDSFDLVITDQMMPQMIGSELSKKIMEIRPDLPVILLTGFSQDLRSEHFRKIGIREYIMKPVVIRELAEAVRKVLVNERPASDPGQTRHTLKL